MATALIGYTGFVGSNIASQHTFDELFNTSNIDDIDSKSYDLVVSAATYAEMWKINQDPEGDRAQIDGLISYLSKIKAKKFVLISTVGVYKQPNGADEDTSIELDGLTPYGTNRYRLEQFVRQNFDALIVRLPGLFGKGLKKNVIYDLLHQNMVERIHADGTYQYYNLANIWRDVQTALDAGLRCINFAVEPVSTRDVAAYCFGLSDFDQKPEGVTPAFWDMHSKHTDVYGVQGPYIYTKQQELDDIKAFVRAEANE